MENILPTELKIKSNDKFIEAYVSGHPEATILYSWIKDKEVIELLVKLYNEYQKLPSSQKFNPEILFRGMLEQEKQLKDQWISVKESKPKFGSKFLGVDTGGYVSLYRMESKVIKIWNITHWMPLPTPPSK